MLEDPQVGAWSGSLVPLVVLIVFSFICCPRFLLHEVKFPCGWFFGSLGYTVLMCITCSNEGRFYVFVVIRVTSSCCLLLPPVSSKAGARWLLQFSSSCCYRCIICDRLLLKPSHGCLCTHRDFLSNL